MLSPMRTFARPNGRSDAAASRSHLGRSLTVKGIIDTDGEVHIHGRMLGRINAGSLVVSPEGYVEGDIVARDAHIGGRFNGRIFALNVTLDSSADVSGRIFHNTVTVERGARVDARMPWRPPSFFETLEQLPETKE
ncbi:MAG TPA: polymer-forming cytoskeletal protein [Rhizomicrobium sp.]|nr:polymer-forming cytoskeletal protein [Rhizomicrobium sp.]